MGILPMQTLATEARPGRPCHDESQILAFSPSNRTLSEGFTFADSRAVLQFGTSSRSPGWNETFGLDPCG
jgi:hypothetical protein